MIFKIFVRSLWNNGLSGHLRLQKKNAQTKRNQSEIVEFDIKTLTLLICIPYKNSITLLTFF